MSTKIHVALSKNFLHSACLSPGQRQDMKAFPLLWNKGDWKDVNYVIADKGYDFYDVVELIRQSGLCPIIPRRRNAFCPGLHPQFKLKYKSRFAIEHFFPALKENKRLALRFDKLDITFFSFFALATLKIFNLLC